MTGELSQRLYVFLRVYICAVVQVVANPGMYLFRMRRLPLTAAEMDVTRQNFVAHSFYC